MRYIPGLLLVLLGVGFLLDAFNVAEFGQLFSDWWPLAVIVVGLMGLFSNLSRPFWPLLIVAVGVLLQLRELGHLDFTVFGLIVPVVLIGVGISLLPFGKKWGGRREVSIDSVDASAIFAGIEMQNKSQNFVGGNINAAFGGVDLDLRDSDIKKGTEASLDVFVAFGGIGLKVPEGWRVQVSVTPLFGGVENKATQSDNKGAPILHIRGTCLFGGVEIKN